MVLVHDDDLTRLDGIYGNIVSRSSVHCTIELMFFTFFQPSDTLQPDILSDHIRCLKPMIYNTQIGESLLSQLTISDGRRAHRKDLSSVCNSASAETASAWVATLSNIFEDHSESPFT